MTRTAVAAGDAPEPRWLTVGSWAVEWRVSYQEARSRLVAGVRAGSVERVEAHGRTFYAAHGEARS